MSLKPKLKTKDTERKKKALNEIMRGHFIGLYAEITPSLARELKKRLVDEHITFKLWLTKQIKTYLNED